ncbi:MAG: hypothetical protein SV910_05825 [Chloroflexota bacterium]|nr:hypothetical protein [Chloroflexota bacterium]
MTAEEKKKCTCEHCGGEAEVVVKKQPQGTPTTGTLVCKVCGSEADIILEEL